MYLKAMLQSHADARQAPCEACLLSAGGIEEDLKRAQSAASEDAPIWDAINDELEAAELSGVYAVAESDGGSIHPARIRALRIQRDDWKREHDNLLSDYRILLAKSQHPSGAVSYSEYDAMKYKLLKEKGELLIRLDKVKAAVA